MIILNRGDFVKDNRGEFRAASQKIGDQRYTDQDGWSVPGMR